MQEKGKTAKSAITLTVISILIKPIGFVKEIIIAAYFGATIFKDAFLIAWAIPNVIAAFVTEGMSQVFVPIFIKKIQEKNAKEAWRIASIVSNMIILVFFALSVLVIGLAPLLVNLIAPHAPADTKMYAVQMTRILSFSVLGLAVSALLTSILNAHRRFIAPALTFAIMNLIIIGSVIFFFKALGIYALALGALFGTLCMILIQIPPLLQEKVHYRFSLDITNKGFLTFGGRMAPMIFATFIFGLMSIIEKVFASGLAVGSISSLDYGFRVNNFVFGIFVPTVTTAAFPTMSLYALDKVKDRFINSVWSTIKMVELFIIPVSIFLITFNHYIVKMIYERGAFTPEATLVSSKIMGIFAVGLFASAATWILFHAFYALKDTTVRIKASLVILSIYVLSNIILIRFLGIFGISLSQVIAWTVGSLFLISWFLKEVPREGFMSLLSSLIKMAMASLISISIVRWAWLIFIPFQLLAFIEVILFGLLFLVYFLIYFCIYLLVFKDKDAQILIWNGIRKFFLKKK